MLSRILLISCFSSRTVFHGSPFLMAAGTFNKLKSVGMIDDNSFHFMGIETVAEAVGLTEYIDASVFPLEF